MALLSYSDMLDISRVRNQRLTAGYTTPRVSDDGLYLWQTFGKGRLVAMYAPNEPVLDYNMVIIFLMAVGTVAVGGYWAGSRDSKK